jgi:hypothetical protein
VSRVDVKAEHFLLAAFADLEGKRFESSRGSRYRVVSARGMLRLREGILKVPKR